MPLLNVDAATFGFGGANLTPQSASGEPSLGEVLAAQREDSFWDRFNWATISQAVASDLASLLALQNAITTQMFVLAPVGAAGFGMRNLTPLVTATDLLAFLIAQVNATKAALIATGATDYSALSGTPDATDQGTAITLANAIRSALGIT